jgi:hypothetical protein
VRSARVPHLYIQRWRQEQHEEEADGRGGEDAKAELLSRMPDTARVVPPASADPRGGHDPVRSEARGCTVANTEGGSDSERRTRSHASGARRGRDPR